MSTNTGSYCTSMDSVNKSTSEAEWTNTSHSPDAASPPKPTALLIVEMFVLTLSVVLNSLTVIIFCLNKSLHTCANLLIASLACSDLCFSIAMGVVIVFFLYEPISPEILSPNLTWFLMSFSLVSGYFILYQITLERWLYIVHPFIHQKVVTFRLTGLCVSLTWLIAVLANLDLLINIKDFRPDSFHVRFGALFPGIHFLGAVILCVVYVHISMISRRHVHAIKRLHTVASSQMNSKGKINFGLVKSSWRNVRLLVTVFGTYFLFMTPYMCMQIYTNFSQDSSVFLQNVFHSLKILSFLHLNANFLVYVTQQRTFRHALITLFRCKSMALLSRRIHPKSTLSSHENQLDSPPVQTANTNLGQ